MQTWNQPCRYIAILLEIEWKGKHQFSACLSLINSLAPERFEWLSVIITGLQWWLVNISLGNRLMPSGNKPLPEPMLTKICHHMASIGHNELTFWTVSDSLFIYPSIDMRFNNWTLTFNSFSPTMDNCLPSIVKYHKKLLNTFIVPRIEYSYHTMFIINILCSIIAVFNWI